MHNDRLVPDLGKPDNPVAQQLSFGHRVQVALLVGTCLGLAYLAINSVSSHLTYDFDVMSAWDRAVPFVPEWVWVYNLNIPMPLMLILLVKNGDELLEVIAGYLVIFIIAGVTFLVVPVHAGELRAVIGSQPETWSLTLVRFYYDFDGVGNCLPSLHVAYSVYAGWWGLKLMPRPLGVPYAMVGLSITLSTMLVKQHFIADVVTAVAVAGLVYWLQHRRAVCMRTWMPRPFARFVTKA
jgi:hypothetical protein